MPAGWGKWPKGAQARGGIYPRGADLRTHNSLIPSYFRIGVQRASGSIQEVGAMERSLAELEAVVRDRICGVCTERTVAGECGMEDQNQCALFRLFPEVARAIQSVESNDITNYIDAIRQRVCSVCVEQAADGSCE